MPSYPWTHLVYGIDLGIRCEDENLETVLSKLSNKEYFETEKKLEALGCDLVYYGLYEWATGTVICIKESDVTPTDAIIEMDELPAKKDNYDEILKQAAEIVGCEFKPKWILCCSYG